MMQLLSCRYNMDATGWKPGSRMKSLLPSTAWLRTEYGNAPAQQAENWIGCSTTSPWAYTSSCWEGR